MICALIMAGGRGTRFWPLSTEKKPKQFLNLIGTESMIQMTVRRIRPIIPDERIFICTGREYVDLVRKQLPFINRRNIIVEPEGRNTMPCITLSAFIIKRYFKDAEMLVLPSDHLIKEEEKFHQEIKEADDFINNNQKCILTFGMAIDRIETGYGYINCKRQSDKSIEKVIKFIEKPDRKKAEEYYKSNKYLWNGGMFLFKVSNILERVREYSKVTYEALKNVYIEDEVNISSCIEECYKKTEPVSIDYGIMEKSNDIYVMKSDIGWDDIGTWKALERYKVKDTYGNIIDNRTKVIDSRSNISITGGKKVVMIGINDTMTLETENIIFVVNKKYMDKLKDFKNIV